MPPPDTRAAACCCEVIMMAGRNILVGDVGRLDRFGPERNPMMLELVEYTVIASTPLISGLLVWLYFIRLKMHRRRSHVFLRLIVGNALVL